MNRMISISLKKILIKTSVLTMFLLGVSFIVSPAQSSAALFGGAKDEACAAVHATDAAGKCDTTDTGPLAESTNKVSETLRKAINLFTIVVGIIAVIMIIIGGLRYITANGDTAGLTAARNTIIYAIIGLIVVSMAQLIVKLVLTKI